MPRSPARRIDSPPVKLVPVRMSLTDVPEVAAIEQRVFADPWSVDSFVAEVERTPDIGFPLVLRDGEELVGYAIVWFIVDEIHIARINASGQIAFTASTSPLGRLGVFLATPVPAEIPLAPPFALVALAGLIVAAARRR